MRYAGLATVLALMAAIVTGCDDRPGATQAEVTAPVGQVATDELPPTAGEDDDNYVYLSAWGRTPDLYSGCQVNLNYENQDYPRLRVHQSGWGPQGCPQVHYELTGADVPKDLISLRGPSYDWFAHGFDIDELAWSFIVTTHRTYEGAGRYTYYPSGNVSGYEYIGNDFYVNSLEVEGITYSRYAGGSGLVRKYEPY
jgi:hypothetical protein